VPNPLGLPPHSLFLRDLNYSLKGGYNRAFRYKDIPSWAATFPDLQQAWVACPDGLWMYWYICKIASSERPGTPLHRKAVRAATLCLQLSHRQQELVGDHASTLEKVLVWTRMPSKAHLLREATDKTPMWMSTIWSILHMAQVPKWCRPRGEGVYLSASANHPGGNLLFDNKLREVIRKEFPTIPLPPNRDVLGRPRPLGERMRDQQDPLPLSAVVVGVTRQDLSRACRLVAGLRPQTYLFYSEHPGLMHLRGTGDSRLPYPLEDPSAISSFLWGWLHCGVVWPEQPKGTNYVQHGWNLRFDGGPSLVLQTFWV